jgi:hypothetical protein
VPEKLKQFQQVDILLQEVANIPEGARQMPREEYKGIARCKHTGHNHVVESDNAVLWTLTKNNTTVLYLEVKAPATIVHDEHKPLPIPAGI